MGSARLARAEQILRSLITTCELHHIKPGKFWDLSNDYAAAQAYFRDYSSGNSSGSPENSQIAKDSPKGPTTLVVFDSDCYVNGQFAAKGMYYEVAQDGTLTRDDGWMPSEFGAVKVVLKP